jgi:hypothetical protein
MSSSFVSQHSRKRPIDNTRTGGGCDAADNNDNDNDNGGGGTSASFHTSSSKSSRSNHGTTTTTSTTTASRATQAQEHKRRQIMQETWGFREVLAECGLLEFAAGKKSSSSPLDVDEMKDGGEFPEFHIRAWASFLLLTMRILLFVFPIQQITTTSFCMAMKMQQLPPPPISAVN